MTVNNDYNITYLIGAGASFETIPLVATLNKRLKIYRSLIKKLSQEQVITNNFINQYINDLDEIIEEEEDNFSIDTYAKELHDGTLDDSDLKLLRLKMLLSHFFLFEQLKKPKGILYHIDMSEIEARFSTNISLSSEEADSVRKNIDSRYKAFWASLLSKECQTLKPNINIISWNYDLQFELSYAKRYGKSLEKVQEGLQIYPSFKQVKNWENSVILKLNGTAGLAIEYKTKKLFNTFEIDKQDIAFNINTHIHEYQKNYNSTIDNLLFHFAWENDDASIKLVRDKAKEKLAKTDVIVIIGYSFPEYNRIIDNDLLSAATLLERIYIQVPIQDYESYKEKILTILPNYNGEIIHVSVYESFKIPNEYHQKKNTLQHNVEIW